MLMPSPSVSIIIPAYNAEKYLSRCLDSIISQTLKKIEIIVINDGSTDETENIIDAYLDIDKRMKKIKQSNKGTGEARNKGLKNALGDYILFIDADDTIETTMVEKMYSKALSQNSDIVICEINKIIQNQKISESAQYSDKIISQLFRNILSFKTTSSIWNKLYKKKLFTFNNLFFPNKLRHNEDNALLFKLIFYSKTISYIPENLYNWHTVENSKSRSISKERLDSINDVLTIRYDFLMEHNNYKAYENEFIHSMLTLINLRINNIIVFVNNDNSLASYIENIIDSLPFFTKMNILKSKKYSESLYFKLLESILKLNSDSILLRYFEQKDLDFFKYYSSQEFGFFQNIIDQIQYLKTKQLYIYGAGDICKKLLSFIEKEYKIMGIIDKKAHTMKNNFIYPLYTIEESLQNTNKVNIVIASFQFVDEIKTLLSEYTKDKNIEINIIHCYSFQ